MLPSIQSDSSRQNPLLIFGLALWFTLTAAVQAQLDVVHWLPPLVTDTIGASGSNLGTQRLVITTPSVNPVNYTIVDGAGVTVSAGTVSNSAPIDLVLGGLVGGNYTSQTAGAGNIIDFSQFNTVSAEGLIVTADEPVFVNLRQRSGAQGASLTAKGCSGIGTEFRVGVMREREAFGTESFRNQFVSVMATEDDTVVTFDDFKPGVVISGGTATTEPPASGNPLTTDPISVTLDAGESYAVGIHMAFYRGDGATASINDLNGSRVTSDKPIVVNTGTFLGSPNSAGARDAGFDQMASVSRAGTEYIVLIGGAAQTSVLESPMVVATEDNTDIFVNGSLTPFNSAPLAAGDYLYLNNNWNADGILYVESSQPTMMFATAAGSNSAATPGFSFIPPLDLDIANSVDNIFEIDQIGPAILRVVTTTGSSVTFNGNTPANGPLAVTGNNDWVAFTQENITGNVTVNSTGPVAASVMNFQNPVGAQGYFSGFPEFSPLIEADGLGCFPGAQLFAVDPSGGLLRFFEWFFEDGTPTGVTGTSFTPTQPGRYFVRGSISATAPCPTADSAILEVLPCPESELVLEKTVAPRPTAVGDTVTFTITVTNEGPDAAPLVEVIDVLPSGYSYLSNSIAGGDNRSQADPSGSGLLWIVDELPATPGSNQVVLTFEAVVQASGDYLNTAEVTAPVENDDLTNNSDTAEIILAVPAVEMEKALASLAPNGGGSFTATYLLTVENLGNEDLVDFQITDSILQAPNTFPAGSTAAIGNIAGLTANPAYNGTNEVRLLNGNDVLAAGTTATIEVLTTFTIDGNQPYQNQALLSTRGSVSGVVLSEPSNNPDTPTDDDPTPVNPSAEPEVALSKTFEAVADNGDGSFAATFVLAVTNIGDEPLIGLSLVDSLSSFPTAAVGAAIASDNLTLLGTYDGQANTELLDGSDRLAPGQSGSVTITVTFVPDGPGPFANVAQVTGTGEFSGEATAARARDQVTPPLEPEMEIDKALESLTLDNGSGLFTATFTVTVTNSGNEPLTAITLNDDLDAAPNNFPVGSVGTAFASTGGLTFNPAFDGVGQTSLLTGPNTLAVGASGTISMTVEFANDASSPYFNQVSARAAGLYTNSSETEPSNDPDTVADDDPTLVDPAFDPQIAIAKALVGTTDNGDGTFTSSFTLTVSSDGNEPLIDLSLSDAITAGDSTFPVGSTAAVVAVNNLTPNPGYDGVNVVDALDGSDRLAGGSSGTVTIAVTFTPDGTGPFANSASITGEGEFSAQPVSAAVDAAVNVSPPFDPELALEKSLASIDDNGDGTFTANFVLSLENVGNEPMVNLQVADNLFLAPSNFPTGSTVVIGAATGGLTPNGSFDGNSDANLLSGTDTLAVNGIGTVALAITFTPDDNQPYANQASATGAGEFSNIPDSALSDDPATGVEEDATIVVPPLDPEIEILKALDDTVDNGDGTFTGLFTLTLENTGNENLLNIQVNDAPQLVPSTLPNGTTATLIAVSGGLTSNPTYNGTSDNALLGGSDTLAVGQVETIELAITFTPDGNEPYLNQATGRGTGAASGSPTGARSDDPATGAIDDGTAVGTLFVPSLEVTKTLDGTVSNGDGSFTSQYTLTVTNTGNDILNGVQIEEDLDAAPSSFPADASAAVLSATGLTVNANFDGDSETQVLDGSDSLEVQATGSVVMTVTFVPNSAGPFDNQVTASGTGQESGDLATDDSGPPVSVTPTFSSGLSLTKNLDNIIDNGGGNFQSIFTISVVNTGDEPLTGVQVSDALDAAPNPFPNASNAIVTGTTGGLTSANAPPFDGNSQPNLLTGLDTLNPGEGGTITVTVDFAGQANSDVFCNQATGTATGQFSNNAINLLSDDPDTPAANDPTKSAPPFAADLTLTKSAGTVTDNGDGTFTAEFTITATNTGNEILAGLQIADAISVAPSTFPAGSTAVITATTGLSEANPAYDGVGQSNLLDGTDSLPVDAVGSVTVEVIFTPDGAQPYANQAEATAAGASSGQPENAVSDDPSTATPNDATAADPPLAPSLDFTKSLGSIVDQGDGSFLANFTLTVTNTGNEPLANVQLVDDITVAPSTFPAGSLARVVSTTGGLTSNSGFDGVADTLLLSGGDTLPFGANASIEMEVTFTPDGAQPYLNQASATGEGAFSGGVVGGISDDPATGASDDGTEVNPPLESEIYLTKELQSVTDNGDGSFTARFRLEAFNLGNEPLDNLSLVDAVTLAPNDFPSGSTASVVATGSGLVANPGYDGITVTETVSPGQSIPVGGSRSVDVAVDFVPDSAGPYSNQATASGIGAASGSGVNALSDDPVNDDATNPAADPNDPTLTNFDFEAGLTTTKNLVGVVDNGNGTFAATYTLTFENTGNEPLVALQASDALSAGANNFPAGSVGVASNFTGGLSPANPAYDGTSQSNLFSGNDTLAVSATGSVTLVVNFTPNGLVSYTNTASGSAEGEFSSAPASSDGTASPFTPTFLPSLNVDKTLDSVVDAGGGEFLATFVITAVNAGNEPLAGLQLEDSLSDAPSRFPAGATASISATSGLTENPSYDGLAVTSLLDGSDSLAVGASATVTVEVRFTPDGSQPYTNAVSGSALGANSANLVADSANELVDPPLDPALEVTKTLDELVDNGNGSFTANFTLAVSNTGNESLENVQLVDAITVAPNDFPTGATAQVTSVSAGLTANGAYDGVAEVNLLSGGDALAVGGAGQVEVAVTFTPASNGSLSNTASAEGTGAASGEPASDLTDATVVDPPLAPGLEVSKNLDSIESLPGGSFRSTFTILLRNTGNESLTGLQVSDQLATAPSTFPVGSTGLVTNTTGGLTAANPAFDGDLQPNMLSGANTLASGAVGTVTVQVEFEPEAGVASYFNQATGEGTGELTSGPVTEPSDNPDTSGVDDDATESAPPFAPEMETTKRLNSVTDIGGGQFLANFTLTVTNTGNEILDEVQIVDPISSGASTFPVGSTAVITGANNLTLATSPAYDGTSNPAILTGTDSLPVTASGDVTLEVTFTPDGNQPYFNQAVGSAVGTSSGQPESDISDDPTTPGDPEDPTATEPPILTGVDVEKALGAIIDNGDGTFDAPYTLTVSHAGNEPLVNVSVTDSLAGFPAGTTAAVTNPTGGLSLDASYDGFLNPELLAVESTLGLGAVETLEVVVTFTPDGSQPYLNSATANAEGQFTGDLATDSDDAPLADPPLVPAIELTKTVQTVADNGDGTFTASYDVVVNNTGNEPLVALQINDSILTAPSTFPAGSTAVIASTNGLSASATYNGTTDGALLDGTNALPINGSASLQIEVTFTPDGNQPYLNVATANGEGDHSGGSVSASDDAPAVPPLAPVAEVEKVLELVADNGDGSFTATYTLTISNGGNEPLTGVQLTDSVSSFPAGASAIVTGTTGGLTPNPSFNGDSDINVLNGTNVLGLGASGSATVEVTFTPVSSVSYENTADGEGAGEFSSDPASDDGTAEDVEPPFNPVLATSKTLDSVVATSGGQFEATFTILLQNLGNEPLSNIQVVDDLLTEPSTFPTGSTATILTASGLAANGSYDGTSNTNLLAAGNSLAVNGQGQVTVVVTFIPDGNQPYFNTITSGGTGAFTGASIGGSDEAPVDPPLLPAMEVTKTLGSLEDHGDGSFTSNYEVEVTNTGNESLVQVQIIDAITVAPSNYPSSAVATVTATTGGLVANPAFDGIADPNLLDGLGTLAVDAVGVVSVAVTFIPENNEDYGNQVTASGEGAASGGPASDLSEVAFADPPLMPALAVSKNLNLIEDLGGGQFRSTFSLLVRNIGTEPLNNVQVSDPLTTGTSDFPAGTTGSVIAVTGGLTAASPVYDGVSQPNMLSGIDTLAIGAVGTITVEVTFSGTSGSSSFQNQALGEAEGAFTEDAISEVSDDPDTPGMDNDATTSAPPFAAEMEVSKALDEVVHVGGGVFEATYTITVTNTGNEDLDAVQVSDGVTSGTSTFPAGSSAEVVATDGLTAATAPVFDGVGNDLLLDGTDSLAIGALGTISVKVSFTPDGNQPYLNQATGTATGGSSGQSESDISDDPLTSDDPEDPTSTDPPIVTELAVEKSLGTFTDNGDGSFTVFYSISISNVGNEPLVDLLLEDSLADFPPGTTAIVTNPTGGLALNIDYDGLSDVALLTAGNNLAIGAIETVVLTVSFTPDGSQPYANTAVGSATGEFSEENTDDSGVAPLADPPLNTTIDLVKELDEVVDNNDGTFASFYTLTVTNSGNEALSEVQITDGIEEYPAGSSVTIISLTGGLSQNFTYDGVNDSNLLGVGNSLAVGDSGSVTLRVDFTPDATSYGNEASANGVGDASDELATSAASAPPAEPPLEPAVAITKDAGVTVRNPNLTNTTTFTITATNIGNEALATFQVNDDILTAPSDFPAGATAQLVNVSGNFVGNSAYNGVNSVALLQATTTLPVGVSVEFVVAVTYAQDGVSSYRNAATATAAGALTGAEVGESESDNGTPGPIKPTTFAEWQATNPLSGLNGLYDNPDGDLSPNLAEYAFCTQADSGLPVFPDGVTPNCGLQLVINEVTGAIDACYFRPAQSNLSYDLLRSSNGATWTSSGVVATSVAPASLGAEKVTYEDVETLLGPEGLIIVQATLIDGDGTHTANSEIVGWQPHVVAAQCETFGDPYLGKIEFSGAPVVNVATRTLDFTTSLGGGDLTAMLESDTRYAIEIVGGPDCGHRFEIESFTSTTVTLAEDNDLCASDPCNTSLTIPDFTGSTVALLVYSTIDDLFPPAFYQAGLDMNTGDNVLVFDPASQSLVTYFLLADPGGERWVEVGTLASVGGQLICPSTGLFTHRRGPSFTTTQFGGVRDWKVASPLKEGYNLIGATHPVDVSAFDRAMLTSGFTSTGDPSTSDQFLLWLGDAQVGQEGFDSYFYPPLGALGQWTGVADVQLTDESLVDFFLSDRSAYLCVQDPAGLPDYLIPSPVIAPPEQTQP